MEFFSEPFALLYYVVVVVVVTTTAADVAQTWALNHVCHATVPRIKTLAFVTTEQPLTKRNLKTRRKSVILDHYRKQAFSEGAPAIDRQLCTTYEQ